MRKMEKALKTAVLAAIVAIGVGAMSNPGAEDESIADPMAMRVVEDFDSIRISGAFKGSIDVNGEQGVTLTGDGDIEDAVQTRVKGGELQIKFVKSRHQHGSIWIKVSAKTLEKVTVDGAGNFDITGIDSDEFELKLPGAADIDLSGKCDELTIAISGAATINAKELTCHSAKLKISGSGNIALYADKEVEARISGMGHIDIYGDPDEVEKKVSGLGRIKLK